MLKTARFCILDVDGRCLWSSSRTLMLQYRYCISIESLDRYVHALFSKYWYRYTCTYSSAVLRAWYVDAGRLDDNHMNRYTCTVRHGTKCTIATAPNNIAIACYMYVHVFNIAILSILGNTGSTRVRTRVRILEYYTCTSSSTYTCLYVFTSNQVS